MKQVNKDVPPELVEELGQIRLELYRLQAPLKAARENYEALTKSCIHLSRRRNEIELLITPVKVVTLKSPQNIKSKELSTAQMLAQFDRLPVDVQSRLLEKLAGRL
jgi:hypothetical protein